MKDKQILVKMIKYIEHIDTYTQGVTYEEFNKNNMLIDACVFNLSQIGELVKNLDSKITDQYKNVPWRQMYGLRNRIVHDYEGVNLKLVWEVITLNMGPLRESLVRIIEEMNNN